MALIVEKKNQVIEFDSQFSSNEDAIEYARKFLTQNSFISSVLTHKKLSSKQIAWVHYESSQHKLEADSSVEEVEVEEIRDGEYLQLVKDMYRASSGRKTGLKLHLPGGISISTVTKGHNIGFLYVYEDRVYVGKIDTFGNSNVKFCEDTHNMLLEANDNLLQLAQLYGHETSSCSMCGRPLEDPKSVKLGMGPVCYKRLQSAYN